MLISIRPFLGPSQCQYTIGCTQFAVLQLHEQTFFKALWHITKRIISCNPFFYVHQKNTNIHENEKRI